MHPTTKKSTRILFAPLIAFCNWLGEKHPVTMVELRYFARFKKMPDFKNPKTLNEKILYLKLFTDTTEWTRLADKYKVREYVKECGLERYLIPFIGAWYDVNDIDYEQLPKSFIFKANNGCGKGSNMVVVDKDNLDKKETLKILDGWLKEKHVGVLAGEPQYKNMKPCIVAENLLPMEDNQKSLIDYKIWCFNGKAYYIMTCSGREGAMTKLNVFDLEWDPHPEFMNSSKDYPLETEPIAKPEHLDQMIKVAETLSRPFPCVRVDLYNIQGKIYFGEMTFTSLGGLMHYYTPEFLTRCGNLIDLNYRG